MDIQLISILAATLAAGVFSMSAAAWLSFRWLSHLLEPMVSVSTGLLLATAFLHLFPEAFEAHEALAIDPHALGAVALISIFGFFLLEKVSLIHHSHHHEGDGHHHPHGYDREHAGRGGLQILIGDSVHNFADGLLIAGAFLADFNLGLVVTLSIVVHEVPHKVSDFMVLLNAGFTHSRALIYNVFIMLACVAGGITGYLMLDRMQGWIPYVLIVAASSFIYIAMADLMPQLQRHASWRRTVPQILLMLCGAAIVVLGQSVLHVH